MDQPENRYPDADSWRDAAMQRPASIEASESEQRAELARTHNRSRQITDPDTLRDQQLYIQGKMDLEEYQNYLLFKHGST